NSGARAVRRWPQRARPGDLRRGRGRLRGDRPLNERPERDESERVSEAEAAEELPHVGLAAGRGVWVVLPTYNEIENLEVVLAAMMAGADLALGSRYVPGGGTAGWPWYRRLISRGGTTFARTVLLLPYRDLTGGFKAWRRELLDSIRLRDMGVNGYGFQIEMTWWAHRRGARIVQVPIIFRERTAGRSKMTGGIVREAMLRVLALRWETIPFV